MLYRSPSAVTVMVTRSPARFTSQAVMVRTVSPLAATELPAAHRLRKSCRPTKPFAAAAMAAVSSGWAIRGWEAASKGPSTGLFQRR